MHVGKIIKELRQAQKMSLSGLSLKSGVQIATLSRMENQKMVGTLESHMNIAKALGIELTKLYSDLTVPPHSPLAADRQASKTQSEVFVHSDKSSYEILTSKVLSKKMMPILLKIEPGGRTNTEQNAPGAEKFVFVLQGKIEVKVKDETYTLSKHNTLYFDAFLPYYMENTGKTLAKVLCVGTPVTL